MNELSLNHELTNPNNNKLFVKLNSKIQKMAIGFERTNWALKTTNNELVHVRFIAYWGPSVETGSPWGTGGKKGGQSRDHPLQACQIQTKLFSRNSNTPGCLSCVEFHEKGPLWGPFCTGTNPKKVMGKSKLSKLPFPLITPQSKAGNFKMFFEQSVPVTCHLFESIVPTQTFLTVCLATPWHACGPQSDKTAKACSG